MKSIENAIQHQSNDEPERMEKRDKANGFDEQELNNMKIGRIS